MRRFPRSYLRFAAACHAAYDAAASWCGQHQPLGRNAACGGTARAGSLEEADVVRWLQELRVEHRDLDDVIDHLQQAGHRDTMQLQRLKKRKLKLKETIAKLESELIPDLDA